MRWFVPKLRNSLNAVLTTMGADYFPRTGEGRVLGLLLAIYGFAVFGYVTASIASLFVASMLIFAALSVLPGDAASVALGRNAPPEELVALRERLGLDRSLVERYMDWLTGMLQGNFGDSTIALARNDPDSSRRRWASLPEARARPCGSTSRSGSAGSSARDAWSNLSASA